MLSRHSRYDTDPPHPDKDLACRYETQISNDFGDPVLIYRDDLRTRTGRDQEDASRGVQKLYPARPAAPRWCTPTDTGEL